MTGRRALACTISEGVALARRLRGPRLGLRVLLYHAVGARLDYDRYGISIAPALFARHMARLAAIEGMWLCGLHDAVGSDLAQRVAVTFDDGYKDNLRVAAPVLLKHRIPFTVFATSSFIESGSPEYLTPADLRELAALPGVTIGSHGATHCRLADCDDAALWRELDGSRRRIEDIIGRPVTAISYPHGSVTRRVAEAARRAGYTIGACSRFDINDRSRDRLLLCRTEIVAADSERVFEQKLAGAWDWRRWRSKDPASW